MKHDEDKWERLLDEAILNFLSEQGEADLEGLLHVLRRTGIRIEAEDLNRALTRLSDEGRVRLELAPESGSPRVRLRRPFVGWM